MSASKDELIRLGWKEVEPNHWVDEDITNSRHVIIKPTKLIICTIQDDVIQMTDLLIKELIAFKELGSPEIYDDLEPIGFKPTHSWED